MVKIIAVAVAALLLAGCAGRLDNLLDMRCAEAQHTITRLQDTADLYEEEDLVVRLQRATRLAKIWCAPDAEAPISPVPVIPEPPVVDGGTI